MVLVDDMRVRWAGKRADFDDADGWRYRDAESRVAHQPPSHGTAG